MKSRSTGLRPGSSSRRRRSCVPSCTPTSCSFRYCRAQFASPGSTGRSNDAIRFVTAAGRGDHDDHHHVRLQQEHLDVPDGLGLQRRRGDEREQSRRAGPASRSSAWSAASTSRRASESWRSNVAGCGSSRSSSVSRVVAVAVVGRHAAGRGVRMREQPDVLELGKLVAHGRRRDLHPGSLDQALRAHGLPGRHVLLDHAEQDLLLALGQLDLHVCRHFRPAARPSRRRPGSVRARSGSASRRALAAARREAESLEPVERLGVDRVLEAVK